MIITGSGETAARETDGGAGDESCDGNACHIDEATPREVGNGVSSTSCLPVSLLGALSPIFTAIICLFSVFFFSLPIICLCLAVTIHPSTSPFFIQWNTIHVSPLSESLSSTSLSKLFTIPHHAPDSALTFSCKGNETRI